MQSALRLAGLVLGVLCSLGLLVKPAAAATLTYGTYLGGSKFDTFYAASADSSGNTYAVGYTTGTLFPTQNAAQPSYGGGASGRGDREAERGRYRHCLRHLLGR